MDLITKLPRTPRKFDAIWVIVDRLTKSAHFLAIRESYTSEQLAELYVKEVVRRHGTDGQSERTIQMLEDMLRACVLDFGGSWDTYLPLAEFSYNNSYHSTIGMPPYEMLYGRRCRTPICWGEVGQGVLGSTEVVQQTTEHIQRIRERLRTAQSRQKSYADKRRSDLEFQVGDRVLLKVSPWKGVIHFRKRGKLGPRYTGPFTVLARVGKVAYRLELPEVLGQIHDTFHVSQLRKCLADETAHVPLDDIQVDESLNYIERPVAVLERKVKKLRNKEIGIMKVQWQHRKGSEWTWEPEAEMRERPPATTVWVVVFNGGDGVGCGAWCGGAPSLTPARLWPRYVRRWPPESGVDAAGDCGHRALAFSVERIAGGGGDDGIGRRHPRYSVLVAVGGTYRRRLGDAWRRGGGGDRVAAAVVVQSAGGGDGLNRRCRRVVISRSGVRLLAAAVRGRTATVVDPSRLPVVAPYFGLASCKQTCDVVFDFARNSDEGTKGSIFDRLQQFTDELDVYFNVLGLLKLFMTSGQGICTRVPLVMRFQLHPDPVPEFLLDIHGKKVHIPNKTRISEAINQATMEIVGINKGISNRVDPTKQRTLAVVTKCDLFLDGLLKKVTSNDVGLGYICIRNRINNKMYDEAQVREVNLFQTHPFLLRINESVVGIRVLANRLIEIQSMIISKCLPDIIKKIDEKLDSLQARLLEMLDKFSKDLYLSSEFSDRFLAEEIEVLKKANGIRLPHSLHHSAFLFLLEKQVKSVLNLPFDFVNKVSVYLKMVVTRVVDDHGGSYPQLLPSMMKTARMALAKLKEKFLERVAETLEMEKAAD
ncbi:hypothetical protein OSB04_002614 [Centaurea solstitialis]|uniref:Integrase catalytic domain-containing protein n=1 Tax=Centaurea solstitialis TaxID=347529 RepID=A0AA38UBJ9_9ASTR|nr:hypothetical protein OSB04_002614 [Centaurea solstitialis]